VKIKLINMRTEFLFWSSHAFSMNLMPHILWKTSNS